MRTQLSRLRKDAQSTLTMEMELLESSEYVDVDGDGRYLLQTIKEGKKSGAMVREFSMIQAHFRIAKFLMNYALKDTRILQQIAKPSWTPFNQTQSQPCRTLGNKQESPENPSNTPPKPAHWWHTFIKAETDLCDSFPLWTCFLGFMSSAVFENKLVMHEWSWSHGSSKPHFFFRGALWVLLRQNWILHTTHGTIPGVSQENIEGSSSCHV